MVFRPVLLAGALVLSAASVLAQSLPPAPAKEQSEDEIIRDLNAIDELAVPRNQMTFALRFGGQLKATFRNVGTISSSLDLKDTATEANRTYNDGFVNLRSTTDSDGTPTASDGRTNFWSYAASSQVSSDLSGINFHRYETEGQGTSMSAKSSPSIGIDVEGSRELWRFGRILGPGRRVWTVGAEVGAGLNTLNAKTTGSIAVTLRTITDTYSLLGAAPPGGDPADSSSTGYTAPSTTTQTVTNADGTTSSQTINTTTHLASTPESRVETVTPDGATVNGLWQIKGAYFGLRAGPWLRWQPNERFSMRFALGGTVSVVGLRLRYAETLDIPNLTTPVEAGDESNSSTQAQVGVFGGIDAEWWMSERTGFFGSASYEISHREGDLALGGRSALVKLSTGLGIRSGLSFKF
ncbi:MAG: hypothetical protein KF715_10865 [Candidatus Didemnitutus sp.]|nr:hypothetical protein [Candidatus Didemnitutus sp.]